MSPGALDVARCEALADRAVTGDVGAWKELVAELWPSWERHVRSSHAMGVLARSDDHVHEVLAKLVEKLGDDDWRGLKRYRPWRERHPDKSFEDWIHIVAANAVRDHVRSHLGQSKAPRSSREEPSPKRLLNEFASSPALAELSVRPPMTAAQTARQLLEFARAHLPANQYDALVLWIDGATFDEIDAEIDVEAGQGQRLVRAAVATLRRHFAMLGGES